MADLSIYCAGSRSMACSCEKHTCSICHIIWEVHRDDSLGCACDFCTEDRSWRASGHPWQGEDKPSPLLWTISAWEESNHSRGDGLSSPCSLQKSHTHANPYSSL